MKRSRGFTFLEVLLACAIVVILAAVMAVSIQASFNLKFAADRAIRVIRDSDNTGDVWVKDVRNMLPPSAYSQQDVQNGDLNVDPLTGLTTQPTSSTSGTSNTGTVSGGIEGASTTQPAAMFGSFQADAQNLNFYTTGTNPNAQVNGGVEYVHYGLGQQTGGGTALVRQVETNLLSQNDPTQFPTGLPAETIVPDVLSVQFSYYDGTEWTNTWDSTALDQLPFAIKMQLQVAGDTPKDPNRTITRFAAIQCATTQPNNGGDATGSVSGLTGN